MTEYPKNPVFCKDCKHLIGVRHNLQDAEVKWKCGHPENRFVVAPNLVTGEVKYGYYVDMVSSLRYREDRCGFYGAWYEKYEPPVPTYNPIDTSKIDALPESATPTLDRLKRLKVKLSDL